VAGDERFVFHDEEAQCDRYTAARLNEA
jgi:hypothetical protein